MQDLGGGERTTGFELTDGVKMSGGPEICQEYLEYQEEFLWGNAEKEAEYELHGKLLLP